MNIHLTIANSFREMRFILAQLNDECYRKNIEIISGATIGQHFRHIMEFYQSLIVSQKNKYVCYDERERNLLWENSVQDAIIITEKLEYDISKIDLNLPIILKQSYYEEFFFINSTYKREIIYCFDHSIHHFALIKIGIENQYPSVKIPANFGIAPSTIIHKQ